MKRYRILNTEFDARANILDLEINPSWDEKAKALWERNKQQLVQELLAEYGPAGGQKKLENFRALGAAPISIVAFHNRFLSQVRDAFVIGAYFPSLTAACALGERILNHLVLKLRSRYSGTAEYKKVYRKDSFDDWTLPIEVLSAWGVLRDEVASTFEKLKDIRHRSLHFNPETDTNTRESALKAVRLLSSIVEMQFGGIGDLPWLIPGARGAAFLKSDWVARPFIELVYLPNCHLVGPGHTLERGPDGRWFVLDAGPYEDRELSDAEFITLYNERHGK